MNKDEIPNPDINKHRIFNSILKDNKTPNFNVNNDNDILDFNMEDNEILDSNIDDNHVTSEDSDIEDNYMTLEDSDIEISDSNIDDYWTSEDGWTSDSLISDPGKYITKYN